MAAAALLAACGGGGNDNVTAPLAVQYFSASDGISGPALWKTDGTSAGTVLVKDINPGVNGSRPGGFAVFNGVLYFSANDGSNGSELWKTDGTAAGTQLVKDINPEVGDSTGD